MTDAMTTRLEASINEPVITIENGEVEHNLTEPIGVRRVLYFGEGDDALVLDFSSRAFTALREAMGGGETQERARRAREEAAGGETYALRVRVRELEDERERLLAELADRPPLPGDTAERIALAFHSLERDNGGLGLVLLAQTLDAARHALRAGADSTSTAWDAVKALLSYDPEVPLEHVPTGRELLTAVAERVRAG